MNPTWGCFTGSQSKMSSQISTINVQISNGDLVDETSAAENVAGGSRITNHRMVEDSRVRGEPTANGNAKYTEITPPLVSKTLSRDDMEIYSQDLSRALHVHNPMELFITFNKGEEKIYQSHLRRQKLYLLPVLVTMSVIHAGLNLILGLVEFSDYDDIPRLVVLSCLTTLVVLLQVFVSLVLHPGRFSEILAYLAWVTFGVQILFDACTIYPRHMPSDGIGWLALLLYVSQLTLPMGVEPALLVALFLTMVHSFMVCVLWVLDDTIGHLGLQVAANILVCCGAMALGLAGNIFMDRQGRKSVLESKSALRAKSKIENVYKEKETLLLSVLPKHIADEMVKDIGSLSNGQFRKIYMSRYENVSILFADIVGFTAISSNVTAAELVRILNELFGSFDVLANKFHQDRIKILGDCYYCICGALEPRSDHAVLCIHMGLGMVEAISYVRESTGKDVNMRVGVHTGACLGGVLGQRQWQFDVLGKEVTLANKMESGGLPGRVHISETTERCLDGEFELEEGNGGSREEELKLKNLQTFLVRSIIKPYPQGTLDMPTNEVHHKTSDLSVTALPPSPIDRSGPTLEDPTESSVIKPSGNGRQNGTVHGNQIESDVERSIETTDDKDTADMDKSKVMNENAMSGQKLEQALRDKDKYKIVGNLTHWLTLNFKDQATQKRFLERSEIYNGLPFAAFPVALLFAFLARVTVLPRTPIVFASFACGEIALLIIAVISLSVTRNKKFPRALVQFAVAIENNQITCVLWSFSACALLFLSDVIPMADCDRSHYNSSSGQSLDPNDSSCHYVPYFAHTTILALIAVSSLVNVGHLTKSGIMTFIALAQCLFFLVIGERTFENYETLVFSEYTGYVRIKYRLIGQIVAMMIILVSTDRMMEWTARKLFILKEETKKEKEMLVDLQQKNEALVFNLMPSHVARQFIGSRKQHKELYSHAYNESGVIFASCPNFNAFYNESAVNNNGLECIRFLNEIISDYDELLNQPCFQSIVKIKTVGSTYMAASGMTVKAKHQTYSTTERWSHLNDLVLFAFALQDVINKINEQSFNNFILRIGINHGPVIAGVIGARKPHYDIWGNTVNVASRMDSIGKAGKIQVVEETKIILAEFGYQFEKRGLIKVKGKGELMTYFLERIDTNADTLIPNQVPSS